MIDSSGSVGQTNFDLTVNFITQVLRALPIANDQMRVACMHFNARPQLLFDFDEFASKQELLSNFSQLQYPSVNRSLGTAIGAALDFVGEQLLTPSAGHRDDVETIVFLLTDGRSQVRVTSCDSAPSQLTRRTVGCGLHVLLVATERLLTHIFCWLVCIRRTTMDGLICRNRHKLFWMPPLSYVMVAPSLLPLESPT